MFWRQDCGCRNVSSAMSVQDLGKGKWRQFWNEIRIWFEALTAIGTILTDVPECAYVLRFVELNHRSESQPWSIRQSAIYNRYGSSSIASAWMFVALTQPTTDCISKYLQNSTDQAKASPFELHVLLLNVVMSNWRAYFVHLSAKTHELVSYNVNLGLVY